MPNKVEDAAWDRLYRAVEHLAKATLGVEVELVRTGSRFHFQITTPDENPPRTARFFVAPSEPFFGAQVDALSFRCQNLRGLMVLVNLLLNTSLSLEPRDVWDDV